MRKIILFWILMIIFSAIRIEAESGESGIPVLMMDSYGARAMALGDTYVGIADDVNSISANVAGLNTLKSIEGSIMYLSYPLDMSFSYLSFGMPLPDSMKNGAIGLSLLLFSMDEFEQYDIAGNKEDKSLSAGDFSIGFGYANNPLKLLGIDENVSVGIGFKYVRSRLVDESQNAIGFDFGVLYRMNFISFGNKEAIKDNLGIGISLQNLGSGISYVNENTPLPRNLRMGIGYNGYKDKTQSFLLGFEINIPNDSKMIMGTGLEYTVMEIVSLRIGYKLSGREVDGLSFGIGGNFIISDKKIGIDYALIPLKDMGTMHSFSLIVKF